MNTNDLVVIFFDIFLGSNVLLKKNMSRFG